MLNQLTEMHLGNTCGFCNYRKMVQELFSAPSFGTDDNLVAQNGIGSLTLVDGQGRFKSLYSLYLFI